MELEELARKGGRTPRGVRGLKYGTYDIRYIRKLSHPSRGAWIEINSLCSR